MKYALLFVLAFALLTIHAPAHQGYVGYSGAPSSNGTCTRSCHQQASFAPTCQLSGFPDVYVPGQQYIIAISHSGTRPINQFNCSVRKDADSSIAGVLGPGNGTIIYSIANEVNGVHWASAGQDSGTFTWQAPNPGVGNVTLYWAGLQGTYAYGADQQLTFNAAQAPTGVEYSADLPGRLDLGQNYPNPFNNNTAIGFSITKHGDVTLEIANVLGQSVNTFRLQMAARGSYQITWSGQDYFGQQVPSGLYFYQLRTPEGNLTRKLTILR